MDKNPNTGQLVNQLYTNLITLAPKGSEPEYVAGYLATCLADIAEKGIDELAFIVDYTNQQIEVREYNKRADARRDEWVNEQFAD